MSIHVRSSIDIMETLCITCISYTLFIVSKKKEKIRTRKGNKENTYAVIQRQTGNQIITR